jgi:hypothetical protein
MARLHDIKLLRVLLSRSRTSADLARILSGRGAGRAAIYSARRNPRQRGQLDAEVVIVDKKDYRQMLSQRGGEGGAIDDW